MGEFGTRSNYLTYIFAFLFQFLYDLKTYSASYPPLNFDRFLFPQRILDGQNITILVDFWARKQRRIIVKFKLKKELTL